jgi:hypothetical protein
MTSIRSIRVACLGRVQLGQRAPLVALSGGSPSASFSLLFRPCNPTRNVRARAGPLIPVITKALPPDSGVKAFVITKNSLFVRAGQADWQIR